MSLRTPLEIGLGGYMGEFYASLFADTPGMTEYVSRGLAKSIVWAPGRMIDQVDDMLVEWRKNDNTGEPGLSSMLPVVIVAISKDFTPAPAEWGLAVGNPTDITIPGDADNRAYKVRLSANEYRGQVVFIAAETHTAHSLAMQFNLWANGAGGRRFKHIHTFAGFNHDFPAVLEAIDLGAVASPVEQKNITILIADLSIRATIPIFQSPKAGEPDDGKRAPAGYPVVVSVETFSHTTQQASHTDIDTAGVITASSGEDTTIKLQDPGARSRDPIEEV